MPSVSQLLLLDLCLIGVLCGSIVLLLRQALKQGRAKKALEQSLLDAQSPVAVNPFMRGRTAAGPLSHEDVAAVFAPQHAVPEVRRPLWSDAMPVAHADPWIDDAVAPAEAIVEQPFIFALEAPSLSFVEAVPEEEAPVPDLPREHVGILFLEDDQDITALRLADVTQFAPRAAKPAEKEQSAPVEFIDTVYADPIDGVPFTAGEDVVPCACGAAYRTDTVEWLRETANGECVQCHRALASSTQRVADNAVQMARSA